ncbi:hypothetical protein J3E69DRAFT_321247 [Trichoderma sp. SZMC 28015]
MALSRPDTFTVAGIAYFTLLAWVGTAVTKAHLVRSVLYFAFVLDVQQLPIKPMICINASQVGIILIQTRHFDDHVMQKRLMAHTGSTLAVIPCAPVF